MQHPKPESTRAATDVPEFVSDLDGGQFEHMLSVALSEVAAAVVDRDTKKGSVHVQLDFERITGTHQVRVAHKLTFKKPTLTGKATEEACGATVLHVGKYGALSLAQPRLPGMDQEQSRLPGA